MSNAEAGNNHGQEEFSIGGEVIGGPKDSWQRITAAGAPIKGAWEFINEPDQNGKLKGHNFKFPPESLVDIYIEDSGEQKVFTAMGGVGASLNSGLKVTKIQLYLHSREWEKIHEGKWAEWENSGDSFELSNNWYPVGTTFVEETPPVAITLAKEKKSRHIPRKLTILGALALCSAAAGWTVNALQPPYKYSDGYMEASDITYGSNGIIIIHDQSIILDADYKDVYSNSDFPQQINVDSGYALIILDYNSFAVKGGVTVQNGITGDVDRLVQDDVAHYNDKKNWVFKKVYQYTFLRPPSAADLKNICNLGPGISCSPVTESPFSS